MEAVCKKTVCTDVFATTVVVGVFVGLGYLYPRSNWVCQFLVLLKLFFDTTSSETGKWGFGPIICE
jgi:hypothetical protein